MAVIDRNTQFFEVDHGGRRFTHNPSGDTLLKHEWLLPDHEFPAWDSRRRIFFDAHPDVTALAIVDRGFRRVVIGDVRDFPWREGFRVGDVVVTVGGPGWEADCARRIVEEGPVIEPHSVSGEKCPGFILEDGSTLFWSGWNDHWKAVDSHGNNEVRTRRPYPGDDLEALVLPAAVMLIRALPSVADDFAISGSQNEALALATRRIMDAYAPLLVQEDERVVAESRFRPVPAADPYLTLEAARSLMAAGLTGEEALPEGCRDPHAMERAIRTARIVSDTMRSRGLDLESRPEDVFPAPGMP